MNRKEEMEALAKDCELYATIIEGIEVAPNDWKDGDPTRREPRETLLKCAAALRASVAPEEGKRTDEVCGFCGAGVGETCGASPPKCPERSALPSDSGKAAPVAWRWQVHGIWHYASGFPVSGAEPLYAALAPATLIEVTEAETVELINLADRENVLPLRFGGNRAWLDLDVATNRFTDHLKKIRRTPRVTSTLCEGQ